MRVAPPPAAGRDGNRDGGGGGVPAEDAGRSQPGRRRGSTRLRAARAWSGAAPPAPRRRSVGPVEPVPPGRLRLALLCAAALAGLALVLHTRTFLLSRLVVTGLHQVTPAEVEADLALPAGTYIWQLRPWVLARRLAHDPLIARASFRPLWPDGLAVAVRERVPVALLQDGQTEWEVSAGARLLRALAVPAGGAAPTAPGLPPDLPVVAGVTLPNPVAGSRVASAAVLAALQVARAIGGAAGRQVAEVTVSAQGVGVLTTTGVPVNYGDGGQAALKTGELLGILSCAAGAGVKLAAVDLSAPATPAVTTQSGSAPWPACPGA